MSTKVNALISLVSNQPDLIRFLDGSGCGHFTGHGDDDGGMISGCISHGNIWSDVSGSWGEGYQYVLATVGAHHRISANFLVGGMVQVDRAEDSAARISGTGWMVGPYFAARHPSHPLFLEGRLLYGQTANRISPLGTFTDSFATRRWLAQLKAQGQYERGGVTLMPLLDVSYLSEAQRRYTDTLGNIIPSQTISLLQASAGLDFRAPLRVDSGNLALTGGISAIHSSVTGGSADYEGWRGRINLGLDFQTSNGETLRLGTFYDGVGSAHREVGANLYIGIRF